MTITLDLPPETEASLASQAEARGVTLDALLLTIVTAQAGPIEPLTPVWDWDRAIDELFDAEIGPGVGEGVMRRENWYRYSQSSFTRVNQHSPLPTTPRPSVSAC